MNLSECISFPKERPFENYPSFPSEDWQNGRSVGYNQAIKECKDAVDKMELDVEKIAKLVSIHIRHTDDCSFWVAKKDYFNHCDCGVKKSSYKTAQYIADNLPVKRIVCDTFIS